MLKLMFLTEQFYRDHADCKEIEQKITRPYAQIQIMVNGVLWGIPLRSHIRHEHVIWTDKENNCGIDLTKAVAILRPEQYIGSEKPHIRENEFQVLKTIDEYRVRSKFESYIKAYKKAKRKQNVTRNRNLVMYSTLQYFEDYI